MSRGTVEQGTQLPEHGLTQRRWPAARRWYERRIAPWWADATVKNGFVVAAQIFGLLLLSQAGHLIVEWVHLPLPGNLVGMLLLLALLVSGVVRLKWIEAGASLLVRHLAFFFVPITVGLMGFGQMFRDHGLGILITLLVSAALGICMVGFCSQGLGARKDKEQQ